MSKQTLLAREKQIILFEKYQKFLTQTQRQALYLNLIEDLSLQEIAQIVATTRSAVYDALKKGHQKLVNVAKKLE